MFLKANKKVFNDIHIAVGFLILFTAFVTFCNIQEIFSRLRRVFSHLPFILFMGISVSTISMYASALSATRETLSVSIARDNPNFHADGYVCAGIMNGCFAFASWLAPSIISIFGWKITLAVGSFLYLGALTGNYFETDWVSYAGSVVTGTGSALTWNSQATYIILNSEINNTYQGISIFWIIYEFSSFGGNCFIYYLFGNSEEFVSRDIRGRIYIFLGSLVICSTILFSFLGHPIRENEVEKKQTTAIKETKKAILIGRSKTMIFSNIMFISIGLNVAFSGVSAASLGFTRYLSDYPKQYAPLTGIMQGIGEIIGCILGMCVKDKPLLNIPKLRLAPIGCILNMVAFAIIFVGLPNSSSISFTYEEPFIELPLLCFLMADVFLGIGDACLHIETYNFLGQLYPNDSSPVFAVFKFSRGLAICIGYYLGTFIGLHLHTVILFIFSFLSIIVYYCNWQSPKAVTMN